MGPTLAAIRHAGGMLATRLNATGKGVQLVGHGFGERPGAVSILASPDADAIAADQSVVSWSDRRIVVDLDPSAVLPKRQEFSTVYFSVTTEDGQRSPPRKVQMRWRGIRPDRQRKRLADFKYSNIVLGVKHSLTGTAFDMFRRMGAHQTNKRDFPMDSWSFENTFNLPWRTLILCEPLSVIGGYEQRRGHLYAIGAGSLDPFDAFCTAWLQLWDWVEEARRRGVLPAATSIICMDRTGYPPRKLDAPYEADVGEIAGMIDAKDLGAIMAAPRFAPYVEWMRRHRELFEFVDSVGRYGSGWWLDR